MLQLRDYQTVLSEQASEILSRYKMVILSMEVRTGKTITALETVRLWWYKNALFLTKKKAISSIEEDYNHFSEHYNLTVTNYESIHKVEWKFDLIVLDECHQLWSFPKPGLKYKQIKKNYWDLPMILLSWTITPESYSQYFHQIHVSNHSFWSHYKNFYRWADHFVKVGTIRTSYWTANDYSNANYDKIIADIWDLILTFTQKEAWFTTEVEEEVLYVDMWDQIHDIANTLKKKKIIESWEDVILADTKVKEMQKLHQIYSWTIKFESWRSIILDYSKAVFIRDYFKWKKIGIFYVFKEEKRLLKNVFKDTITDDLNEFNKTDKHIMLQIVSWREWISLKSADHVVYYNISFSALSYRQSRDRLSTMDRLHNKVYWIFTRWWLEKEIYKAVQKKKSFTTKIYAWIKDTE